MSPESFLAKATPAVAFCFLLNQILERESWARARVAPFAGQSVELFLPLGAPFRVAIAADGRVEEGGEAPAARISLRGIEGASPLANELRALVRELRWDFEEELSRVMGDVAAQRVGAAARALGRWPADAGERLVEALAAYATDEARLTVPRAALGPLARDIARLQAGLAVLEQRIARLA